MQTTRARIVELLRGSHTATVDDITHELDLAPATVRRHLDVLQRDGLVEMRSERQPLGRPHFVFRLTASGAESLYSHPLQLTSTLLQGMLSLEPAETRGRSGRELAALIFDRLVEQLLRDAGAVRTAGGLDERIEHSVDALARAGFDFEAYPVEGGYLLQGAGCPCRRLLSGELECEHEARVLTAMLGIEEDRIEARHRPDAAAYLIKRASEGVL